MSFELLRLGLGLGIGFFVGIERERRRKEAGVRTFAFCSLLGTFGGLLGAVFANDYVDKVFKSWVLRRSRGRTFIFLFETDLNVGK